MRNSLRTLLHTIGADLRPDTARGQLVRSAGATMAFKMLGAAVAFAASLLYARALGPRGYGLYAYVIAWSAVLTVPAGLGMAKYLIREGSRSPHQLLALRAWADKRIVIAGAAAGLMLAVAALLPLSGEARWLFMIAAPIPLLTNLASVRQALLQARGWIASSQWPTLVLAPASALLMLAAWWWWRGVLTPIDLMCATLLSSVLPCSINAMQLRRAIPHYEPSGAITARLRQALPFMWLGGFYLLISRTDLIMLGAMLGAEDAGIYAAASKPAEAISLVAFAANTAVAPTFAKLRDDPVALQRLFTSMGRRVLLLTTIPAVALVFFSEQIIVWLYGPRYAAGATVMSVLGLIQVLVVSGGSVATLLNMTGHERPHLRVVSTAAATNIALNAMLIPIWGITGAAAATGLSVLLSRILMQWILRKRLNMTSPLL